MAQPALVLGGVFAFLILFLQGIKISLFFFVYCIHLLDGEWAGVGLPCPLPWASARGPRFGVIPLIP